MIKKLFGYIIAGIAAMGFAFFRSYKGELIPYPALWFILSIVVLGIGLYIVFTSKTKKEIVAAAGDLNHRNKLIANGEQIKLDIDNCEIRENNYYEEIPDHNFGGTELIVAAFDPNEDHLEKYVDQSAIIYHHKIG